MAWSTCNRIIGCCFCVATIIAIATASFASKPAIGVAPFSHQLPNVRNGLASVMARELSAGGYFEVVKPGRVSVLMESANIEPDELPGMQADELAVLAVEMDYLLVCDVCSLDVSDKDVGLGLGGSLGDAGVMLGLGTEQAQVVIDVSLLDLHSGEKVSSFSSEGLESRKGLRIGSPYMGWLGSVNIESDGFRETNLGRAAYKAIGGILRELYETFEPRGSVLLVGGNSVVISLGESSGLELGDELLVLRKQELKNSEGEPVWTDEQQLCRIMVVEFQHGRSLCLVLDGEAQIKEGDQVQPLVYRLVFPDETDRAG